MTNTKHDTITLLRQIMANCTHIASYGCSDRYCVINKRPMGMHTNGGCRCATNLQSMLLEGAILTKELKNE